jgi:hypothetical protein
VNLIMRIAEWRMPVFVKKRELKKLFRLTASALGLECPSLNGLSFDRCLAEYARFTKTAVERAIDRGEDMPQIQDRLFQQANRYGLFLRRRLGVAKPGETMRAGKILYRAIGIDFQGTDQGTIEINACFFSGHYSPPVCRVVSSLDAGIMAGLSGGGALTFTRRITEGFPSCKARLQSREGTA